MARRQLGLRGWRMAVAVLAVAALAYQAWRSRWLWGLPEGGEGAAPGGSAAAFPAVAGDPLGAALDRYMSRLAAYGFSGSVLVAKGGRVLLNKGYGLADRGSRRAYTADTLFDIASISKQFTAAGILRLEMAGKLKVEDTLGKFFPEAPADKAAITLHQLLTHTSGLRDTFGEEYAPVSRAELMRRVFASQLLGPPGRRYRYSNGGYSVLAAVLEVASGGTYEDWLRAQVFTPAGMRWTGFRLPARELPYLARGYGADGDWGTPLDHPWAADGPYWDLRGNGGILSTTGDLYRWHLALAGDAVLSPPEREKYQTGYVSEGRWSHTKYAYGWSVGKSAGGSREISHIGGNGYFESDFRRYPDDGGAIILSGNSLDYSALAIGDHLENRLFGQPDAEPPAVAGAGAASGAAPGGPHATDPGVPQAPEAAATAARCAGAYALPGGERLTVSVDAAPGAPAGRLAIAPEGPAGLTLLLGTLRDDDRKMVADRNDNAAAALAAARQGDDAPFADVMGLEPDAATALLHARLAPLTAHLGAWKDSVATGGAARGGRWFTYVRCVFDRGAAYAELGWAGPTAETLRFLDALPPNRFAAESPGTFAAFDVRTGATLRAACALPAGTGPAAAVNLSPSDPAAAVQAVRVP
jgi:CubicO group peptidase (beta-lactamase class C family)